MKGWFTLARTAFIAGGLALALFGGTAAADVPRPSVPLAAGDQCVEPTEVMRRDHHRFLMHQRDETVHGGIRGARHSLVECIDCHVQPQAAGAPAPRANEPEHFCASCHIYAGVKIDCFECHADRPARDVHFHSISGRDRHHVGGGALEARDLELLASEGTKHE